jgi:hypothetical protein
MGKKKYEVLTWDAEKEKFTPQQGVRRGPYTIFGLRKAFRKLQRIGYDTSRGSVSVWVEEL